MRIIIERIKPWLCLPLVAALGLAVMAMAGGCGGGGGSGGGRIKVAASIQPLADLCRQVGGDLVEVELMVPAGASPHTYEPTAAQMRFLSEARLLVLNGLELEGWAADILSKAGNAELVVVETTERLPLSELIPAGGEGDDGDDHDEELAHEERGGEGHSEGGHVHEGHSHGAYDPHVWLDPTLAAHQVEAVRDALAEADPERGQAYRDNAAAFLEELKELDAWVRERTDSFGKRSFVAFHSSWVYFARRYGLDMAGVVEEFPGREPSASDIAALLERMKAAGAAVIFAEPQFSPRAAQAVADASGGAVSVAFLDPLGDPRDGSKDTYVKLIRYNVEEMAAALR